MPPAIARHTGTLESKAPVTSDVAHLRIALDAPLAWTAGQFIRLEGRPQPLPAPPATRCYSLATAPGTDPLHIELLVRRVPGGACSNWIHDTLQPGTPLTFLGPMGLFHLSDTDRPLIGIAGSSGMSPLRAIFRDMALRGIARPSVFFFGARTQADLFFIDEWRAFETANPWFRFVPILSDEPDGSPWTGERGLVTDAVSRHFPDLSTHEAYLCGSPGMITAAGQVLTSRGLPPERTFYDKFNV